jgi:protein-S-isoprenylcysteine O-methyltransferase Ste14
MIDPKLLFIVACFLVKIAFWLCKLSSTKKTVKNTGGWVLRFFFYFFIALFVYLQYQIDFLGIKLWPDTLTARIIADIVTFIGLLIMLWARKTLDRNWSADIVLKEKHELITSGPYAYVRHPIYAGLILMVLGVVLYINTLAFTIFFILFVFGAYYKAKKEERLLVSHFGDSYLEYKKKVKSLIPYGF